MSRAYTVATIALAIGSTDKWVDNALSHHHVSGVQQSRQGVRRKISVAGVLELAVSRDLTEALGIPLEHAIIVARSLARDGELRVSAELTLLLELGAIRKQLEERLVFAVEAAPLPKRGRRPGKAKRGA